MTVPRGPEDLDWLEGSNRMEEPEGPGQPEGPGWREDPEESEKLEELVRLGGPGKRG
jgi:hypothetical protein